MREDISGYIVVTGIKRSGTSAVMYALREAGIPICGFKFPESIQSPYGETLDGGLIKPFKTDDRAIRFNPTGYWEHVSITRQGLQSCHDGYDGKVVKVLVKNLPHSCLDLIHKVIFVMRNPHCVLQSRITCGEIEEGDIDNYRIHALSYMNNICVCWRWLRDMLRQVKLVVYEELVDSPMTVVADLCKWIGRGDSSWGAKAIDVNLNRSQPLRIDDPISGELDIFYQLFVHRNFEAIMAYDLKLFHNRLDEMYKVRLDKQNPKKEVANV